MSDDPTVPGAAADPLPEPTDADTRIADAAASALARARAAAAEKGLRPGMKPKRRRRLQGDGATLSGSARDGRDPALLGDQLDRLLVDRGWKVDVAVGSVMGRWPEIVGADIAAHVEPLSFTDGVLTVRADSTAWATQIRLLSSSLLARVEEEIGAGAVTELRVLGPSAPSWNRGTRRSPDSRGPRDTYG
jgi:predicted nucleic acid-binding Zn ribbon protein